MPEFGAAATSEEVVEAFVDQVRSRTFVITGAEQPCIGSSMAIALARGSPSHIILASKNPSRVNPVLASIRDVNPAVKVTFVQVDISDCASVRSAANKILDVTGSVIDVLLNSAGNTGIKEYTVDDKASFDLQVFANQYGHFLLTNLLAPALVAGAQKGGRRGSRVINLTCLGYRISPVHFDHYNFPNDKNYDLWTNYRQGKMTSIFFSIGLFQRLGSHGVSSFAAHPGSDPDTNAGANLVLEIYDAISEAAKRNSDVDPAFDKPRFKTYAQIGATPLIAALDPELSSKSPGYLENNHLAQLDAHVYNSDQVEKHWKLSERLVHEEFTY
ncbi:hypothetical protein F5B22DRAFT_630843 [Xylaria bambusicola]|uniref:uncharacterized protein n=1 Tax=Xylaria bambusicola TaxID=326684 RepID=UPI002007510A|nr:uncharacterized protein F5B22DRAFT_630843 [Xylaria bambusicola]KAI0503022.1 hypothetical protein F5B22DRAFT_630843 [Xylaria bambusicola]